MFSLIELEIMVFKGLVAVALLGLVLGLTQSSAYPVHASCKITWSVHSIEFESRSPIVRLLNVNE